ncbi:MAG: hypothetical protein GQ549_05700 [Gammaproteobacteria bacterium]|nr:hypothetical protein [Gammaproteobacteria bacterium]
MSEKQEKKPLSSRKIEAMKLGDPIMSDIGENRGLRIICGNAGTKTFFYRYTSPLTKKLAQVKPGVVTKRLKAGRDHMEKSPPPINESAAKAIRDDRMRCKVDGFIMY